MDLVLLGSKPFGILISACGAHVRVTAEPTKADVAAMNAIRIGLTRSDARQESNVRINTSILSAIEVGSVVVIGSFVIYKFSRA